MHIAALVMAAGRGMRAGGGVPKQYRLLAGEPVLKRTLTALLDCPAIDSLTTVIGQDDAALYAIATADITDARLTPPVHGRDTRSGSVRAGLEAIADSQPDLVLIHDAARPFISGTVIMAVIDALSENEGAFPTINVSDALWMMPDLTPVSRDGLARAQTPQGFRYAAIAAAHGATESPADDDVAIAKAAGMSVVAVPGDPQNFKITHPGDFERAARTVRTTPDIRTGQGFDVHAFEPGNAVILNGISIPFGQSLKGHSDADVAMHAITDAIYGAMGAGDIGQWFPPSEARWKGATSDIFLDHAVKLATGEGFDISHIDCTIICELPKIGPHARPMRERLSGITGLDVARISVKATTSERLGFTGRGEGIAALATATLIR